MKRFLTLVLCAVLVLGMIPASIISALAQGKGVAKNETTNHSLENAPNQYIPETITVDGKTDDLGWKEWITVDSASGVWDAETVAEEQKADSYEYSIRRDHEYLYAAVVFGDGELHDFNIYFSADSGVNVTTVSFDAENKTVGANEIKCVTAGGVVEFSYDLGEAAATNADYKYFIAVEYGENSLYYPAIYPNAPEYKAPNEEYDAAWGNALSIMHQDIENGRDEISSYVDIDGKFNEAYWSYLTTYHHGLNDEKNTADFKNGDYDLMDFNSVRFSAAHHKDKVKGDSHANTLRLKTDIRMDKDAIYGGGLIYCKDNVSGMAPEVEFRVFVRYNDKLYKLVVNYKNESETSTFKFYNSENKEVPTADLKKLTTAKILKRGGDRLFSVEFRIDLNQSVDVINENSELDVTSYVFYNDGTNSYLASLNSGEFGDNTAGGFGPAEDSYAYHFKWGEVCNDKTADSMVMDGVIDTSIFKALVSYDRFLFGAKRNANNPECKQFAFALHSDYEYLYGAALVDFAPPNVTTATDWDKKDTDTDNDCTVFTLWINNDFKTDANNPSYDFNYAVKIYLDGSGATRMTLVPNGGDSREITLDADGADAIIKKVSEIRDNYDKDDNRYAVEFKIPINLVGLNADSAVVDKENVFSDSVAVAYAVSVDDTFNGSGTGLIGPRDGEDTFDPNNHSVWATIFYNGMSPAVVPNGRHNDWIWIDDKGGLDGFTEVDYTNSTVNTSTDRGLSYRYKVFPGYENLYVAAIIDSDESKQFSLWIKTDDGAGASHRFTIRIGDDGASALNGYCYRNTGDARYLTVNNGFDDGIRKYYLKHSINEIDGKTYVEFVLNYDFLAANGVAFDRAKGFKYFVAVEDYFIGTDGVTGSTNEMVYPAYTVLKGNNSAYEKVNSAWDDGLKAAAAVIGKLAHFAPEVVEIDGVLDDTGWDPNGWTEISAGANASVQSGENIYTDNGNEPFTLKYQIRHDGEYLYVAAIYDMPKDFDVSNSNGDAKGGTKPSFRIWINPKDENGKVNKTFQYLYDVAASNGTQMFILPTNVGGAIFDSTNSKITYAAGEEDLTYIGADGNVTTVKSNGTISYPDMVLRAAENIRPDYANGGNAHVVTNEKLVYDMIYGDTVFYGYTDIVQENENCGTTGEDWYAKVENKSYTIGHDHAVIGSGAGKSISSVTGNASDVGNSKNAIIEFKVKISEFDPNGNGFEYSINATIKGWYDADANEVKARDDNGNVASVDYALHYPAKYTEQGSEYNYFGMYFPYWCWYNGIDFDDVKDEAKLRNNCTPVVTLGAKICENYIAPDNQEETGAIRFGARYEEKYIRYLAGMDDADYWDVSDMGIVIFPADNLEGELTLETEGAVNYPADNIVKWKNDTTDGWSNFADYENFVFYITLWGIDSEDYKDMNFAFRGYMTFYEGNYDGGYIGGYGDEFDFYSETIIRSFNEVKNVSLSEEGKEDDNSTPVLPDGEYGESQPPVEDQTSKNS